jgi:predicted anti-sigma-YlaC factor YlaD
MIRRWLHQRRFMREHRWTNVHLNEYLDGELGTDERHRVDDHVGLCPECRRMLETLRETVQGLMSLRTPAPADLGPGIIERLRQEPRGP